MDLEFLRRLAEPLTAKAARARGRASIEAAMAAAALAACAGGPVGLAKRLRLDQILDGVEVLRGVDPHGAVELFEGYATALREDPPRGRERALATISGFAGAPDMAPMLLNIACAMAEAEAAESAEARAEVACVAQALGLPEPPLPRHAPAGAGAGPGAIPGAVPGTVIVLGNEKGGTGKSTAAMHLAIALLLRGHAVGTVDLDGHQGTLSRYIANRTRAAGTVGPALPLPRHRQIVPSELRDRAAAHADERAALEAALEDLAGCRFVILDTPGSHAHLSRLGHEHADILITPLNDSFLDIDVLARLDRGRREVVQPSAYGGMVLELNERRHRQGRAAIDWIVMRNRLAHIDARNTREMDRLLRQLGGRMGFRLHAGISERVAFRELFYSGLTFLDPPVEVEVPVAGPPARPWASYGRARQEVDDLVAALRLPEVPAVSTA